MLFKKWSTKWAGICFIWPEVRGINEVFYGMVFQTVNLLDYTGLSNGKD